jgi:hypothetical protein
MRWDRVLLLLATYRLLAPGSEWRLHREWFERSAMADLLGEDHGLAEIHKLYRCHDRLLEHKQALFDHLVGRWRDLFNISFDVLLYDLTSTYFEADPPFAESDKRRHGYSRDHRPDCVQVVIALVVTPEGLPLAYEVLPGNTADNTTLRDFLARIERQYGLVHRRGDRGVAGGTPNYAWRSAALFGPGDHDGADDARGLRPGVAANYRANRLGHRSARACSRRAGLLDLEPPQQNAGRAAAPAARDRAVASCIRSPGSGLDSCSRFQVV